MELGGVVGSSLDAESNRQKAFLATGILKKDRTPPGAEPQDWRCPKMAITEAMPTIMPLDKSSTSSLPARWSNSHSLFPEGHQMLSFSSQKQDALGLLGGDPSLPCYSPSSSSLWSTTPGAYVRTAGLGSGSLSSGVLMGTRGPFTPSQWMELEHQAMIYKYIDANAAIPTNLLMSLRKGLSSSGYSGFSAGSSPPIPYGWGSFQLGFSGNTDPEPGRCRRTDGKKWRCSRDAVADQKYCERHINRGRHRSRKPVEGHNGHAKAMPIVAPSPGASAAPGGALPTGLAIAQQQIKDVIPASTGPSSIPFNRILMSKEKVNDQVHDSRNLSMSIYENPVNNDRVSSLTKQCNPFEESSSPYTNFGQISSSSPLYSSKCSSYLESRSFAAAAAELNDRESQPNVLRHFIDTWPKNRPDCSTIAWPEMEEVPRHRTQLSISIPLASSDFSSSSSPTAKERLLTLSPLKSSREFDPIHMGLGVGILSDGSGDRRANWAPVSWGAAMGGPLGEVLNNTNKTAKDHSSNSSSALNLMTDGWDSNPRMDSSSPTGVLQKATFGSLSSSTGSSPRADNYDGLLGSTLVMSTSIPSSL